EALPFGGMLSKVQVAYQCLGTHVPPCVSDAAVSNGLPCGARTSRSTSSAGSGPAFAIVAVYLIASPITTAFGLAASWTETSAAHAPHMPLLPVSAACCTGT